MNSQKIKNFVSKIDEGYVLNIPLENEKYDGVVVTSITMFVPASKDDYYRDLAVNWSTSSLSNNNANLSGLLMRDFKNTDEVTKVMSFFYRENGFTERLRELLVATGFSKKAVKSVGTSEWGMQDEGRASYDAFSIADEVHSAMNL